MKIKIMKTTQKYFIVFQHFDQVLNPQGTLDLESQYGRQLWSEN